MELTRRLAEHALSVETERLPSLAIEKTKQCILDLLGIAICARHDAESSPVFAATVDELLAGGSGRTTAVGHRHGFPAHYAALLNGAYGHSLDFDDTHTKGSIHPGAPTIPAALAAAEEAGASGPTLIAAVVAAYEVTCRLSMALTPKVHYDRGFHPTATCGTFGAAAGAAVAWGLSRETLEHAFGLSGSMAAGSLQFLENGAWNKRLHVGMAAHNGILAARFARNGAVGASHPIEGNAGFLRGYTDAPRPERLTEAMGERWEIVETALKPYPACRFTHSPIDSLIALVTEENLRPEEIESLSVGLAAKGVDLVGAPAEHKKDPRNIVDGQFSMHWTAAVAALKRRFTWADYALIRDPDVLDLVRRSEVVFDAESERAYPDHFASTVCVRARGREYRRFALDPKGEPSLALTWDDVIAKFSGLVEKSVDAARSEQIVAAVRSLDTLSKVGELTALLRA